MLRTPHVTSVLFASAILFLSIPIGNARPIAHDCRDGTVQIEKRIEACIEILKKKLPAERRAELNLNLARAYFDRTKLHERDFVLLQNRDSGDAAFDEVLARLKLKFDYSNNILAAIKAKFDADKKTAEAYLYQSIEAKPNTAAYILLLEITAPGAQRLMTIADAFREAVLENRYLPPVFSEIFDEQKQEIFRLSFAAGDAVKNDPASLRLRYLRAHFNFVLAYAEILESPTASPGNKIDTAIEDLTAILGKSPTFEYSPGQTAYMRRAWTYALKGSRLTGKTDQLAAYRSAISDMEAHLNRYPDDSNNRGKLESYEENVRRISAR